MRVWYSSHTGVSVSYFRGGGFEDYTYILILIFREWTPPKFVQTYPVHTYPNHPACFARPRYLCLIKKNSMMKIWQCGRHIGVWLSDKSSAAPEGGNLGASRRQSWNKSRSVSQNWSVIWSPDVSQSLSPRRIQWQRPLLGEAKRGSKIGRRRDSKMGW